jgi:hypothetical protein
MTRCRRILYSQAEMQWLENNRTMVISDYHRAFCAAFGRSDVTAAHLHGLRKRLGWKVGRTAGRFVGRHLLFSAAEIEWLRDNCTKEIDDYHRTFCAAFSRNDVSAAQIYALRKRQRWGTGRTGRFAKGSAPANKGKPAPYHPNSARTRFKKGQLPHNTKFAGHERVASHGYVEISVKETNPHTGFERRYVLKHRWLWEKLNGPVPAGMVLKCKGDVLNTDPSNWELVPRGLLPRLNGRSGRGYDDAPDDLKLTIMAVAKLEHRLREKRRQSETTETAEQE